MRILLNILEGERGKVLLSAEANEVMGLLEKPETTLEDIERNLGRKVDLSAEEDKE
jgi:hypothetical protein